MKILPVDMEELTEFKTHPVLNHENMKTVNLQH